LLTWTKFTYNWLGDWSCLPHSRIFYSSALDSDEGLIYIFGGYANYDTKTGIDQSILMGTDCTADNSQDSDNIKRNVIRLNRLNKLQRNKTSKINTVNNSLAPKKLQIGINQYNTSHEMTGCPPTLSDVLIVDVSSLIAGRLDGSTAVYLNRNSTSSDIEEELAKCEVTSTNEVGENDGAGFDCSQVNYLNNSDDEYGIWNDKRLSRMIMGEDGELREEWYLPEGDGKKVEEIEATSKLNEVSNSKSRRLKLPLRRGISNKIKK
jgi:hypothetical protein